MRRHRARLITEANARWWTLGAMCFALFMIMLDNTVVNVALPSIQRDLGATVAGLEWTINAYTLSFGVLLATGGRLGDIFGRRRAFLVGVVLFALSSAIAGLAPDTTALVASRVVQGVGAALMMPATLSIVTNAFPAHERGKAIGTWAGVSALALAIGPVLGGFLTEHVSWRAIFYINVPVAAGAVAATLFAVRESRDETVDRRVDYAGVVVLTGGLTALVLALIEGNAWGWQSPAILALLAASVLGLAAFAAVERRVSAPMVEFRLFASRNFLGASAVAFIVSFAMLAQLFFLALYMQNVLGYSALGAGIRFLPSTLAVVAIAPLAGRLTDRIGARWPIVAGLVLVALANLRVAMVDVGTTYSDLLPAFVVTGLGMALVMSPMSTAAMNAVSEAKAGIASGVLSMSRMVGGTFGVAAIGAMFQSEAASRLRDALEGAGIRAGQLDGLAERIGSGAVGQVRGLGAERALAVANEAFVGAFGASMALVAGVVALGALMAALTIRGRGDTTAPVPAAERDRGHPPEAERIGDGRVAADRASA